MVLSRLKRDTRYHLIGEAGQEVLHAEADGGASLYGVSFKKPLGAPGWLVWRWKTEALVAGADNRDKSREDAPLRVIVAFDGDRSRLSRAEQRNLKWARLASGREAPYATLMYIWGDQGGAESLINSAHSGQVKMLVVAAGDAGLGAWQSVRRNVREDYRRAFGKPAGRLLSVAVMTDTDNTGATAAGDYADFRLECEGASLP